jgi:hypothetical protein
VLVANDRDIVALGAAHHSKPKHPVKGQSQGMLPCTPMPATCQ